MRGLAKRLGLALIATALISQLAAASAQAHHIPGATYKGTHSGGGGIEFKIADNGKEIRRFKATNIRGDGCFVESIETTFGRGHGPDVESYHYFSQLASAFKGGGLSFDGAFNRKQRANGHFSSVASFSSFGNQRGCDSREFTWQARTTASPARSSSCLEAKREVTYWTRELRRAREANAPRRIRRAKKRLAFWRNEKELSC